MCSIDCACVCAINCARVCGIYCSRGVRARAYVFVCLCVVRCVLLCVWCQCNDPKMPEIPIFLKSAHKMHSPRASGRCHLATLCPECIVTSPEVTCWEYVFSEPRPSTEGNDTRMVLHLTEDRPSTRNRQPDELHNRMRPDNARGQIANSTTASGVQGARPISDLLKFSRGPRAAPLCAGEGGAMQTARPAGNSNETRCVAPCGTLAKSHATLAYPSMR